MTQCDVPRGTLFRIPMRTERWGKGMHGYRPCPVCGKPWRPWALSYLPCHARCLLHDEDKQIIVSDTRGDREIARHYGISLSVVRATRRGFRVDD